MLGKYPNDVFLISNGGFKIVSMWAPFEPCEYGFALTVKFGFLHRWIPRIPLPWTLDTGLQYDGFRHNAP
jgi:hypothetical protein